SKRVPEVNFPDLKVNASPESGTALVECFDPETDHCRISGACRLRGHLERAQEAFFGALGGVTLADLLHRPAPLVRLLTAPAQADG
ncbi:MAG: Rrf2 family transcriptional regulator, partial [Myxococcota bacterium]